jgi:hypothetical protein
VRYRCENTARGLIGIEALSNGDEPDSMLFQGADVVQAVH